MPELSYDQMTAEAARVKPGCDGVIWTPYLFGERTPHLDAEARAAFVGISASTTRGHFVRAVMEGVAFSLRDTFTLFEELGIPVAEIRLGGGGARGALWRKIQADVYGRPVERLEAEEGGAFGAALLAGTGVGAWPDVATACAETIRVAEVIEPSHASEMEAAYREYRKVYPALKAIGRA
jgi:xylulokinase